MESELLKAFDQLIARKGYANRSEALRDLVRELLVRHEWQTGTTKTCGVLCLVYDHEAHDLAHKLTHLQHEALNEIVSSLHVHLDEHNCMEIVILRGMPADLQSLSDRLISTRGVKYGQLMMATSGARLS